MVAIVSSTPVNIVRGDSWDLPMQWRSPGGAGIDISGFTVFGTLVLRKDKIAFTVENGRVEIVDASQGKWRYVLSDAETDRFAAAIGVSFRVQVVNPSGKRATLAMLSINIV
jgi:hypothetical protein